MIVYKDYIAFTILGEEVLLFSDEMCYGRNTIAEINKQYHYLDNEYPSIATAIYAWQEVNNKELSDEELHQVMVDNGLISAAI